MQMRRIIFEIVIRSAWTECRRRCGCYWTIETLNHLGMIELPAVFFSSSEVGANGHEFSLKKVLVLQDARSFIIFSYFYFIFSYLIWDMLCDLLLMCDLHVARLGVAVEKGFRSLSSCCSGVGSGRTTKSR